MSVKRFTSAFKAVIIAVITIYWAALCLKAESGVFLRTYASVDDYHAETADIDPLADLAEQLRNLRESIEADIARLGTETVTALIGEIVRLEAEVEAAVAVPRNDLSEDLAVVAELLERLADLNLGETLGAEEESVAIDGEDSSGDAFSAFAQVIRDNILLIAIAVGIGVILTIAVVIAITCIRKKKNISKTKDAIFSDLGKGSQKPETYIRLISLNNAVPNVQKWELPLTNEIIVGRNEDCHVHLANGTVSRQHCKIYITNNLPFIENLSYTNNTQINGKKITTSVKLNSGDKIKCGQTLLFVEALFVSDSSGGDDLPNNTVFVNV